MPRTRLSPTLYQCGVAVSSIRCDSRQRNAPLSPSVSRYVPVDLEYARRSRIAVTERSRRTGDHRHYRSLRVRRCSEPAAVRPTAMSTLLPRRQRHLRGLCDRDALPLPQHEHGARDVERVALRFTQASAECVSEAGELLPPTRTSASASCPRARRATRRSTGLGCWCLRMRSPSSSNFGQPPTVQRNCLRSSGAAR